MNSITKRWVRGSLFFTLAVLLIAEVLFLYFMITGYYTSVRDEIISQFRDLREQLTSYPTSASVDRELQLRRMVEEFDAKEKFDLMLVDRSGNIVATATGLPVVQTEVPKDIVEALEMGDQEYGMYQGRNELGEKVMALTMRTPYSSGDIEAMRLVTSLELVDGAIRNLILVSMAFLAVVILASIISGVYFIRSIVIPLQKIEASAGKIARGNFDTRVEEVRDDEVGSLGRTINHMAEELSKNEKMKNDFISSVSHELRTPLTSIKGWAETVGRMTNSQDPNFRRGMAVISGETDRLYNMVEELLDFSRMQNGLVLETELLDLAAEVEEAVLLNAQRAATQELELRYEAPELPVAVMADKNRLRQVLVNVLDNALKYSPVGSHIELEMTQEDGFAQVSITDQGPGIASEDLENIKIKFYKGKGAVRGSGIGLAVVEEIMKAHQGTLEILSEAGKGTRVVMRFPLHKYGVAGKEDETKEKE